MIRSAQRRTGGDRDTEIASQIGGPHRRGPRKSQGKLLPCLAASRWLRMIASSIHR